MKYIEKKQSHEPATLKEYRETTPNASYKGFVDQEHKLKKALLKEQGALCAYCMRRISLKHNKALKKPRVEVEHYLPQETHPDKDLDYNNMLGVCNGDLGHGEHCDKSKKEKKLQTLNPLDKNCEKLVTYNSNGDIKAIADRKNVLSDIELLNLNDQNLIDARRNAIDLAIKRMQRAYPLNQWTKALIQKEIDGWESRGQNGKLRPYCKIVVWYWKQQKRRNRYPAK